MEGQLRGLVQKILEALGVVETGHLNENAVGALALDDGFGGAEFVDTAADIRLIRRIRRDLEQRGRDFEQIREQYYATVRPMHLAFVEPSKLHADVVIPEGGQNRVALELLLGRVREFIRGYRGPGAILPADQ